MSVATNHGALIVIEPIYDIVDLDGKIARAAGQVHERGGIAKINALGEEDDSRGFAAILRVKANPPCPLFQKGGTARGPGDNACYVVTRGSPRHPTIAPPALPPLEKEGWGGFAFRTQATQRSKATRFH